MYHKLFRDALHPWKRCIAKGCISVYWHACRWYDWTGFTWRPFSTLVLHLTWLDETVLSCVKCIIHFSRMLCILENGALHKDAYLCIDMRLGDMTRQGSTVHKLLSSTCSIANINVAMVDNSPLKLMHKLWKDALCFHVSVDGYFWLGFNNVEVTYLFTWRLFSIPVLHLTWLDETVLSCVKCIIKFSGMLCILENGALQNDAYLCIDVHVGDMIG